MSSVYLYTWMTSLFSAAAGNNTFVMFKVSWSNSDVGLTEINGSPHFNELDHKVRCSFSSSDVFRTACSVLSWRQ